MLPVVSEPFRVAERYIELRKKWGAQSWAETLLRVNEILLTPIITLFLLFVRKSDLFGAISSATMVAKAWYEWFEFWELRFKIQDMFFTTMVTGGPFIVTNDPTYMPYVWADGATRAEHQGSGAVSPGSGQ